jgi:hypothetical protein
VVMEGLDMARFAPAHGAVDESTSALRVLDA